MPDETAQQKAERQTRLCHAMGVMRLQDKVDKLELDATKISYPRGMRQTRSGPAADITTANSVSLSTACWQYTQTLSSSRR